jgi:hypothetical protein
LTEGPEFESTYFETLVAHYQSTKKERPKAKARFGALCERFFGVSNTQFVYNLQGNTQIMRNVRQVTKSVNPKGLATWPLAELYDRLCEYLYDIYDTADHPALGQSPREAFLSRLAETGERRHRVIPYDQEFLIFTLPTTAKESAKVTPGHGVKIHHVYYWCEAFRDPEVQGQQVAVRFDPFDAGVAYAFVRRQWVQCHSEYYAVLKGRSQREVMLAGVLTRGATVLTATDLRAHAPSVPQCEKMLSEALEGEARLSENAEQRSRLRARLGLNPQESKAVDSPIGGASAGAGPAPQRKPRRKPGQRRPSRDPIGPPASNYATAASF